MADWRKAVMIAMPTFGTINVEMFMNLSAMNFPIHTPQIWALPVNKPVAEARNECVESALERDCAYLYFRDYDTLAPPDTLPKLMARDVDVIGGLYVSKQKPPWPLLFKDGGPCMDWEFGDVVKCDAIGMGCTLIKMDVFKRMGDGPWFRTFNERPDDTPDGKQAYRSRTEDIHFCNRMVEELGLYPYIDTSALCVHRNFETGDSFFYEPDQHMCVWSDKGGKVMCIPPVAHKMCKVTDLTKESEKECE